MAELGYEANTTPVERGLSTEQRSLMMVATRRRPRGRDDARRWIEDVPEKVVRGYCFPAFFGGEVSNVCYLGPTMAPAEWCKARPDYLEHPVSAFDYYRSRGVERLIAEEKYMGSRAVLCVQTGRSFGVTRYGFDLHCDDVLPKGWDLTIKNALKKRDVDYAVLDCELLPWNVKGEGLIEKHFRLPGRLAEAARLFTRGSSSAEYANAKRYLDTLSTYDQPEEKPHLRCFDLIRVGRFDREGKEDRREVCASQADAWKTKRAWLDYLLEGNGVIRTARHTKIDLTDPEDCERATKQWEEDCKGGCEGWVLKVADAYREVVASKGNTPVPYMKVRGKDYLRIIYGMDYVDLIPLLSKRNIARKRRASFAEYRAASQIAEQYTIAPGERDNRLAVASFFSCIDADLDKTL